jgi:hypothetical protein
MADPDVERETVVVDSGSRGGGGAIVAILVVLVLGVLAFLFFGGFLDGRANKHDVNVNVALPNVNVSLPQVNLPPIHIDNSPPARQQQPATNQSGQ